MLEKFETTKENPKKRFLQDTEKLLELTMEGNKRRLSKEHEGRDLGQVPRIYVRTEDIKRTFSELKGLDVKNPRGGKYSIVAPKETLSDIYNKYSKKFSTPLGKFIEKNNYKDSILILHANCKDMKIRWTMKLLTELVENSPNCFLQEQSVKKNIFFILVFDRKDWCYHQIVPRGLIRQPAEVLCDYLFQPEILIPDEWKREFRQRMAEEEIRITR